MTVRGAGLPALAREEDDPARPASLDTVLGSRPNSMSPDPRLGGDQAPRQNQPDRRLGKKRKELGRILTQDKLELLDEISEDKRISPTTFEISYWIMRHINHKTCEAWPSQKRLMMLAGVSETTLRACLKALIDCGYLEQLKRGVRNSNKYRFRASPNGGGTA